MVTATVIAAPMLQMLQSAGEAVLTMTADMPQSDLMRSRLTRFEVQRQLQTLADTLAALPDAVRHVMPEIDWAGWRAVRLALPTSGTPQEDAIWFAVRSLVPATLSWLQVYRQSHPSLFEAWC
jgi:uncharacterized protein with HEPN domain